MTLNLRGTAGGGKGRGVMGASASLTQIQRKVLRELIASTSGRRVPFRRSISLLPRTAPFLSTCRLTQAPSEGPDVSLASEHRAPRSHSSPPVGGGRRGDQKEGWSLALRRARGPRPTPPPPRGVTGPHVGTGGCSQSKYRMARYV